MITTTTKQHLGLEPGGARPVAAGASGRVTGWRSWSSARHQTAPATTYRLTGPAAGACAFGVTSSATTNATTNAVTTGDMGLATIERSARHLATRST